MLSIKKGGLQPDTFVVANDNHRFPFQDHSALSTYSTLTGLRRLCIAYYANPPPPLTRYAHKPFGGGLTPIMEKYFNEVAGRALLVGENTAARYRLNTSVRGLSRWLSQDQEDIIASLRQLKPVLDILSESGSPQRDSLRALAVQNFLAIFDDGNQGYYSQKAYCLNKYQYLDNQYNCFMSDITQGFSDLPDVYQPYVYPLTACDPETQMVSNTIQHLELAPFIKQRYLPSTSLESLNLNQPETYRALAEFLYDECIMQSEYAFAQVFRVCGSCDLFELYPNPSMLSVNKIPTQYFVTNCYGLSVDRKNPALTDFPYVVSKTVDVYPKLYTTYQALANTMALLSDQLDKTEVDSIPISDLLNFNAIDYADPINSFIEHVQALIGETRHYAEREFNLYNTITLRCVGSK